jgi:tripartite-type tricarboxylate transporter receptor subunit TctC
LAAPPGRGILSRNVPDERLLIMRETTACKAPLKKQSPTLLLTTLAVLALSIGAASAQEWPNRPVKMIVPYGPGGITDVIARLVADRFSKALGRPFVVENRGGAGGAIGTEAAARAPKDGYTVYLAGGGPLTVVPQMQKVSYDPVKDLAPVGMISYNPMAFTVRPNLPVQSLREFIDYAKAHPGKINYSVGGTGSSSQLAPALLSAREHLDMLAVPYQSMPPAISALMSGTVQMFFGNITDVIEQVRAGKFRLLAVSSEARSPAFPEVPTVAETVPGFTMIGWHGLFVPEGTPQPIIARLSGALAAMTHDAEFVGILDKVGIETVGGTPADLAKALQSDIMLYRTALEAAGLIRKGAAR